VNAVTGGIRMKSLTIAGPASGNVTLAGSTAMDGIHGNVTLPATGLTRTYTGAMTLSSNSTGLTFTTNGVTLGSAIEVNGVDCGWSLGSALTSSGQNLTVTNGSIDFATYNVTVAAIRSVNTNSRTISCGSGTIALSASEAIAFATTATPPQPTQENQRANLTFNGNTSTINISQSSATFIGNNQTFNTVAFIGTGTGTSNIYGANTFANLSIAGNTATGIREFVFRENQTITGTLTLSAGTNATTRMFLNSNSIGQTRTLTVAVFSGGTDVDFRDITITGAASPISGTRLGDCKGNSGITFDAPKTVYVRSTSSANWSSTTGWSATSGGAAAVTSFPLAQDTVIFPAATYPATGSTITIDSPYNIGTIDMSLRTTNTVVVATSTTPAIYGNWINGTGTTISGTGIVLFAGRGSQLITSQGKAFTYTITINSPSGAFVLQDAFTCTSTSNFSMDQGTFDANNYNVTVTGTFGSSSSTAKTIAIGSGTFAIGDNWNATTSMTVTGSGTISMTRATSKSFTGGGLNYTNITLNQGGAGQLNISGNNTFKDITNTYKSTGATIISLGTTTQQVTGFTAAGEAGRILTVQGSSATSPGTLVLIGSTKPDVDYLTITGVRAYSLVDTWYAGANSTNNGSLGWLFEAAPVPSTATGNFFLVFG
jgi:hypothetical protein